MEKRLLGSQGLSVAEIGLGCMGMSFSYAPFPEKKVSIELIHKAYESGITLFDTAEVYGPYTNEDLLGEAIAPFKNEIVIAKKLNKISEEIAIIGARYPEASEKATGL